MAGLLEAATSGPFWGFPRTRGSGGCGTQPYFSPNVLPNLSIVANSGDCVFCSDMLNLAEFVGLSVPAVASLPTLAYFHENQLTYPVQRESERDLHFAYTNFTTLLAAERVWFNSEFHRRELLSSLPKFLGRMPDHQQLGLVRPLEGKSRVYYPGIDSFPERPPRSEGAVADSLGRPLGARQGPGVLFRCGAAREAVGCSISAACHRRAVSRDPFRVRAGRGRTWKRRSTAGDSSRRAASTRRPCSPRMWSSLRRGTSSSDCR